MGGPLNSLLKVRVIKDDGGAFASQFEGDVLQVRLHRRFHNPATYRATSRERYLLNVGVFSNGLTNGIS